MTNARGRGGTAQDAHVILSATTDVDANTIACSSAGHPDPMVVGFPDDIFGRQCRQAVWAMIPHAQQGGRWASASTVAGGTRDILRFSVFLRSQGITGFHDPSLSFTHIIEGRNGVHQRWRSSRAAVAWALRAHHPLGERLAEQVLGDRLEVQAPAPTLAYTEAITRLIESAARDRFLSRLSMHKSSMQQAGLDTGEHGWLLLSAEKVAAAARRTGGPLANGLIRYIETGVIEGDDVRAAVAVEADDLSAAMILLCLAENLGPNLSALQSLTARSVIPVGAASAMVDMTKSRAGTSLRVASSGASLHTLAGLGRALVGLTRFARARRRHEAETPEARRHADLLLVADGRRLVMEGLQTSAWGKALAQEIGESVTVRRLRETANLRGKRATGRGTVIGHSAKSNMAYLAEGMPAEELARLVVDAQDDIVARAKSAVSRDATADAEALSRMADIASPQLVERGVATCVTGAIDPVTEDHCNRGILGCFTCPSGYRTDANIPGLRATVALTEAIRGHDPDEWATGPARTLNTYATAALGQLDPFNHARDGRTMLAVVAALYNEVRG